MHCLVRPVVLKAVGDLVVELPLSETAFALLLNSGAAPATALISVMSRFLGEIHLPK